MSAARRRMLLPAAMLMVLGAGCPRASDEACSDAPADLVNTVQSHIREGGHIRHAVTHRPPADGRVFLSFENRTAEEVRDDDPGHVVTLAVLDAPSPGIVAVDERAREQTDYPAASFDVRADGAVESRGCVIARRQKA